MARLAANYAKKGRTPVFDALLPALEAGGTLRGGDAPAIAAKLGITENALRATLFRMLIEYREILESEVFQTVESRADVADEIAHLHSVFRRN